MFGIVRKTAESGRREPGTQRKGIPAGGPDRLSRHDGGC